MKKAREISNLERGIGEGVEIGSQSAIVALVIFMLGPYY